MLNLRLVLLTLSIPLAACTIQAQPAQVTVYRPAPPPPRVVVRPPPPPLRFERVPAPPQGRYIWRPGHWEWMGNAYGWVPGQYVFRQPGWHHWVHGHWAPAPGGGFWVPGHWS